MSEENKAAVRRCLDEVWNKGHLAEVEKFYSNDANYVDPSLPETRGVEAIRQVVSMDHAAFPDLHFSTDDLIAEGDRVVLRWTVRGTHKGEFLGLAATGRQIDLPGRTTFRFSGGKIVEMWANWDRLGMMQQLGITTPPSPR